MTSLEDLLDGAIDRRRARVFRNGANLAVRIPRGWNFDTEEVDMIWTGEQIVIEAVRPRSLSALFAELAENSVEVPPEPEDSVADPVEL